jgi:predicted ester cyclase
MEMFRIEDHKIVEQWVSVDALNLLSQLGAL